MKLLKKLTLLTFASVLLLSVEVRAQDGSDQEPIGSETETTIKKEKGKVLQDLTLGTVQIKYKIQTPRIKFAMQRIPIELTVDEDKLENLSAIINNQPKRLIYLNKRLERPSRIESSKMIPHTLRGQ